MRPSLRSRVLRPFACCLLALAGGCSFIADEFVWIDRAAPSALAPADRGVDATQSRP